MQKRARRGALSRGASAAPMPRHRSASIDLRSTTATAVPKHGGRSTSFHQLCLCAKSSSTARLCRDPATVLPTRRLLGHRATQIGNYGLFVECLRSTTATAVPAKFVHAGSRQEPAAEEPATEECATQSATGGA